MQGVGARGRLGFPPSPTPGPKNILTSLGPSALRPRGWEILYGGFPATKNPGSRGSDPLFHL